MDVFANVRRRLAFSERELDSYLATAPFRYKSYPIEKRNGGTRIISQPSRDLKILQRFILDTFLNERLKVHDVATAYRIGKNISDNARPHASNAFILKMDFRDFFPSINSSDFISHLILNQHCSTDAEAVKLSRVFFRQTYQGLVLSIGSPGSPLISNSLMFEFDKLIFEKMAASGVTYTRYSDDMTFSTNTPRLLIKVPEAVDYALRSIRYPKLLINTQKTVFTSKKFNRTITGIVISNEGNLSIGHQNKRILRSKIFESPNVSEDDRAALRGYISFVMQIEPDLIKRLELKYPSQFQLLRTSVAKRKFNVNI
ncbi:MAG: retron St85 family RNA-directed DNA polymerase [Allorhizobium sp.]